MRLVGLSGARGVIYGIRLLQVLREQKIEMELIITETAREIIRPETGHRVQEVEMLRTRIHDINDLTSSLSSGGYHVDGMVIVPCSMKSLAGIVCGYTDNLLLRAVDITLKEGRPRMLVPKKTPLNIIHLENMLHLAKIGVTILPAMPGYYYKPDTVIEVVDFIVGKILDRL
jgi:4-hydroxy-3-polyprenylbenzoate decarboxylase